MTAGDGNAPGRPQEPESADERVAPGGGEAEDAAEQSSPERKRRARRLAARVIVVQIVTLVALWVLQSTYGSG